MLLGLLPQRGLKEIKKQYGEDATSLESLVSLKNILKEGGMGSNSIFNKSKWLPIARDMPFLISHYCCTEMKKKPLKSFYKKFSRYPFIGVMAHESRQRRSAWLQHGCNAFNSSQIMSQPLAFWTDQDILQYIKQYNINICSVYGNIEVLENGKLHCTGCQRTGCVFCGFSAHNDKQGEERFLRLKETHPKQYNYCINGGQWVDNPYYDPEVTTEPDEMGWVNWNPKKIWIPSKEGLGFHYVFDCLNEVYGKDFIRYK